MIDLESCLPTTARENVLPTDTFSTIRVARLWYQGAIRELDQADFLQEANLQSIQAICILPLCSSNFGQIERERLLLGIAINMARSLGMHKLGREGSHALSLEKQAEWSTPEGRALGRRLWWTLVICDWYVMYNATQHIRGLSGRQAWPAFASCFDCAYELQLYP